METLISYEFASFGTNARYLICIVAGMSDRGKSVIRLLLKDFTSRLYPVNNFES